jgi:hypothetical protein
MSLEAIVTTDGTTLEFILILPETYVPGQEYPVAIAFPAGEQHLESALWGLETYYIRSSIQRNWILICPIAPEGNRFFEGGETLIPELFGWIETNYEVEAGKYHLTGISAGGISSFRVAVENPDKVLSILVFPGWALGEDLTQLNVLTDIPIIIYSGQYEAPEWTEAIDDTVERLTDLGFDVTHTVMADEGHVIERLNSAQIFNHLDSFRPEHDD